MDNLSKSIPKSSHFLLFNHDIDEPLNYMNITDADPIWQQVQELLAMGSRNILFVGPPGTSKTTYALSIGAKLVNNEAYRIHNIQFHQSFGYEDFMEGYVPSQNATAHSPFKLKAKVFFKACQEASKDFPDKYHVLVIDELNRGDPSRIFGEALTYMERRDEWFELSSEHPCIVPKNLIIIATMNPYDKSISDIDMAMERRFDKIFFYPSSKILERSLSILIKWKRP